MTIKQQGGIFGRNPAFNNVDVENNLTVGGTVTHNGTQNITGQLNVDNLRLDGNTVSVLDANGTLVLVPNGTGILDVYGDASIRKGNYQDVSLTIANGTATVGNKREILFTDQAGTTAYIRAYGSGYGSGLNNVLQLGSTTNYFNLTPAGNIAFPSGQGIDFSATAGTGTSELFDDYEEGTWTPALSGSTSGSIPIGTTAFAYYTKVGRVVKASAYLAGIDVSSSTLVGNIRITGFPYSSLNSFGNGVLQVTYSNILTADVGDVPIQGGIEGTYVDLRKGSATGTYSAADLNAAVTGGVMVFNIIYETGA